MLERFLNVTLHGQDHELEDMFIVGSLKLVAKGPCTDVTLFDENPQPRFILLRHGTWLLLKPKRSFGICNAHRLNS